jgi:DNA-binding NarL/FixJ family response regulator
VKPPKASTSSVSGPGTTSGDGSPGRAILHDRQWLSLARSLQLSDRELEILQGIFDDQTDAAIASELRISAHTVHSHLQRLYHKLGVASRCALMVRVFGEHLSLEAAAGGVGAASPQPASSDR